MQNYIEERFKLNEIKILGLDEAGRGNIAGPLIVAGCCLNIEKISKEIILEINDSKKINKKKRDYLSEIIKSNSLYKIETIDVDIINEIGPKKASILGMEKIINSLEKYIDVIFVDFERPKSKKRLINFIHGDSISLNIAAASILAKNHKDTLMKEFIIKHPKYKKYGFLHNSGYGTKQHLEAIKKYGIIEEFHRLNYAPVKKIIKN